MHAHVPVLGEPLRVGFGGGVQLQPDAVRNVPSGIEDYLFDGTAEGWGLVLPYHLAPKLYLFPAGLANYDPAGFLQLAVLSYSKVTGGY